MKPPASAKWYFSILTDRRGIEPKYRVKAVLSTGRKVYSSYYDSVFTSKQKAQSRVKDLQREQGQGVNRIRFSDFCNNYITVTGNSKQWVSRHRYEVNRVLNEFTEYLNSIGIRFLDEIRETHIEDYLVGLTLKIRSKNFRIIQIRAVLKKAYKQKLISELPEIETLKWKDRQKTQPFTPAEMKSILNYIQQHHEWLFSAIVFLNMTGLRRRELCLLKWDYIKDNEIVIPANITKSSKERHIPISGSIKQFLDGITRSENDDFIFHNAGGKKLNPDHLTHTFGDIIRKLGYTNGYKLHSLRATFITNALSSGADIIALMDIVGHRQLSTTQGYTSPFRESKKAIMENIPDMLEITGYKTEKQKAEEAKAEEERKQKALDDLAKDLHEKKKRNENSGVFSVKPD